LAQNKGKEERAAGLGRALAVLIATAAIDTTSADETPLEIGIAGF
jgi:hypothetical protein